MIIGIIGGVILGILFTICCYDAYKSQQILNEIKAKTEQKENEFKEFKQFKQLLPAGDKKVDS